ncbi:MAG: hypothetical protein R3E48_15130 [Burkholderiaceae bacterium]
MTHPGALVDGPGLARYRRLVSKDQCDQRAAHRIRPGLEPRRHRRAGRHAGALDEGGDGKRGLRDPDRTEVGSPPRLAHIADAGHAYLERAQLGIETTGIQWCVGPLQADHQAQSVPGPQPGLGRARRIRWIGHRGDRAIPGEPHRDARRATNAGVRVDPVAVLDSKDESGREFPAHGHRLHIPENPQVATFLVRVQTARERGPRPAGRQGKAQCRHPTLPRQRPRYREQGQADQDKD